MSSAHLDRVNDLMTATGTDRHLTHVLELCTRESQSKSSNDLRIESMPGQHSGQLCGIVGELTEDKVKCDDVLLRLSRRARKNRNDISLKDCGRQRDQLGSHAIADKSRVGVARIVKYRYAGGLADRPQLCSTESKSRMTCSRLHRTNSDQSGTAQEIGEYRLGLIIHRVRRRRATKAS
jgi:hypothetical protein